MTILLAPLPIQSFRDNNGNPLAGGLLYTYQAGTSTLQSTYTDASGTTPNANPVVLNSRGEASVWLTSAQAFKLVLQDSYGVLIWSVDQVASSASSGANSDIVSLSGLTTALSIAQGGTGAITATAAAAALGVTAAADLAAPGGAALIGTLQNGTGGILRTLQDKASDTSTPKDKGALVDGTTNDFVALQNNSTDGDVSLNKGITLVSSGLSFTQPIYFRGRGTKSTIAISSAFPGSTDVFSLSPAAGVEKRNWGFENFAVKNASTTARDVFFIDLAAAGKFLNKLSIKNVIADQVTNKFIELLNPNNVDGLFSSVFEDNWSMNGYYLDNVGDSVVAQRNTVSGVGVAFYINQLPTASHVILRDNNLTSAGGALSSNNSTNLVFEENQVEVTPTFTGSNNAAVGLSGSGVISNLNPRITHNNINCQANASLSCIAIDWALNTQIDGNSLYCNPLTGSHIVIGPGAQDTYIGINRYFSSTDGTLIAQRITDNGVGTKGVWKTAALSSWANMDTVNEPLVGYFKQRDDVVMLRGRLSGPSSTAGQTLFILPIRFCPAKAIITFVFNGTASVGVQIVPTGEVQLLTAGVFSVSLNSLTFSTR